MNKSELIQYLYAMEKQVNKMQKQDSRLNGIRQSINKLKNWIPEKQPVLSLPNSPTLETPNEISGFAFIRAAFIYVFLLFSFILILSLVFHVSTIKPWIQFLIAIIPVCPALIAGNMGKEERKKQAYQQAEERIQIVNQRKMDKWLQEKHTIEEKIKAQKALIEQQKKKNADQIAQLENEYRTAEEAKKQAQSRLAQYGNQIGLHSHYWTSHALHEIWTLLDRGRADTLKEAINRYESDDSQRRHNQEMAYYASEQADAERRRAQAAEKQAEYARQQAAYSEQQSEYARQQAEHAEAVRKDVAKMRDDQEWDRIMKR